MKTKKTLEFYIKTTLLGLVCVPYLAMFNNCAFVGGSPVAHDGDGSATQASAGTPRGNEPVFDVIEGKATVNIVNFNSALHSMVSLAGTEQPSAATRTIWRDFQNLFSTDGSPESVTAPMWLALTNLAGSVCVDLIDKESSLSAEERRLLNAVNFSAVREQAINPAVLNDMVNKMARSFWGREATDTEKNAILDRLAEANQGAANNTAQTRNSVLFVCTGMLASVSAVEM